MPLYTYHCPKCDHNFEDCKLLREDKESTVCPKCKAVAHITEDYIGQGVSLRFKGPGFYENDYRVKG